MLLDILEILTLKALPKGIYLFLPVYYLKVYFTHVFSVLHVMLSKAYTDQSRHCHNYSPHIMNQPDVWGNSCQILVSVSSLIIHIEWKNVYTVF